MIALEPPDDERQAAGADRRKDLGVLVARDVPAHGEPRHRNDGVADPANAIRKTVIVDAALTGIERGVDMDHRAGVVGGLPERIEVRRVKHAADAPRQGRDHGAAKARGHRSLEHRGCGLAVLHRQRRERHETRLGASG